MKPHASIHDSMVSHPFDRALMLQPLPQRGQAARFRGHTSDDYANVVGPFGGITAAQALQAIMRHPERMGEPLVFTGNFGAALADGAFLVEARPVRTNRSTQHWTVTMHQPDENGTDGVVFTATAITAGRRDTWGAVDIPMPSVPAPDEVAVATHPVFPEWCRRYDMRWVTGGMPAQWDGAESPDSMTRLWVRDRRQRPLDFPALLALCDVGFPRLWLRRARMTPAGTVSLGVYFHADGAALAGGGAEHVLAEARGQCFFKGYFDQTAVLWRETGQVLATTHQMVYYKE